MPHLSFAGPTPRYSTTQWSCSSFSSRSGMSCARTERFYRPPRSTTLWNTCTTTWSRRRGRKYPKKLRRIRTRTSRAKVCETQYKRIGSMLIWSLKVNSSCSLTKKKGLKEKNLPSEVWRPESHSDLAYQQQCTFESTTYQVGEYVYVQPSEANLKPHIVLVERLWEDDQGDSIVLMNPFGTIKWMWLTRKGYEKSTHTWSNAIFFLM